MVPCLGDGCSAFDRTTGAHDSSGIRQTVETNSVVPGEVLPVLSKIHSPVQKPLPVRLDEALSAACNESLLTRICQTDGPATTPERSASPESWYEKTKLTSETPKCTRTRRGRPSTPAYRPNASGSRIRKLHDAHRGGFRRTPRVQLSHQAVSKEIRVPINPVTSQDRALMLPSPLKSYDYGPNSQQPVASKFHGTPLHSGPQRTSEVNKQTTPPTFAGTGLVPLPSESSTLIQEPVVPPSKTNCDCLQSALRMLEELETRNHRMQHFSAWDLSQYLATSLGTCIRILECKPCIRFSEQMMLMIIIAQRITKMFSGLATRFVVQDQSIVCPESTIPLPRLVLIQQLRLERVLNHLGGISRSRNWQTHLAMLDSVLQHSKDIMDRLQRLNRRHHTSYPIGSDENNPIILDDKE